jgi:hypothetical protein
MATISFSAWSKYASKKGVRILQSLVGKEYSNLEEISVFITLLAAHDSSYIHLCMELARKSRIRTTKKERKKEQ